MSTPDTNPHRGIRRVVIWLFLASCLAALIACGVACYRQAVAVGWLEDRVCKFQGRQWSGWPCDMERRLSRKSTERTWSRWIPGAQPSVVVSNWFNPPTPGDGLRLRPWHGMQTLHLTGTFGDPAVAVAFFKNLGPKDRLAELYVADRLYDDACTVHLALYPNLQKLYITKTAVTGASFPTLPRLQFLYAMSSGFTDAGCRRLATCLDLRAIDLGSTQVTVEGVRPLLSLPHLEWLRVRERHDRDEVRALVSKLGLKVEVD